MEQEAQSFFDSAPPLRCRDDVDLEGGIGHRPGTFGCMQECLEPVDGSIRGGAPEEALEARVHYALRVPPNLEIVGAAMKPVGRHAMFYFAAAVSGFYVPWNSMSKIKQFIKLLGWVLLFRV
ncbi:hypothetical protein SELMODRAFT_417304 [Selaginella moellendorffii]|uniref:Uncharacterized protein n=1 Tax=Selaginella moellendorffii TaxID=88036 RepID=D8S1T1_SELML|nr:hypothetical protein SELMODRAFT_417304 [Selaginella moellendorffii]